MTFEVIWTEEAEDRLAEVWMAAPDRGAVTRAAHEIDVALEMLPMSAGKPLFDTVRQFGDSVLTVEFEVDQNERRVYVMNVWSTAEGKPDVKGN